MSYAHARRFGIVGIITTLTTACGGAPATADGEPPVRVLDVPFEARAMPPRPLAAHPRHVVAPHDAAPADELSSLALDACDEPDFAGATWLEAVRGSFTFRYLPGTAAERDLDQLAAVRNTLYAQIAEALGVRNAGPITVVLSPNRAAAKKHGYGMGIARMTLGRIEVIYTGDADAYETVSPGHEIAHVLSARIDGTIHKLPLLMEGLSEYLDGSGRDLHDAYVATLRAGVDADAVASFSDWDVHSWNYQRAGSFVKFLIERHGMERFLALWRASSISYVGEAYRTTGGDVVQTGADLERALARIVPAVYGAPLDTLLKEWRAELQPHLDAPGLTLSPEDRAAIANVIANVDVARSSADAARLRTAMEGFYCDRTTDDARLADASLLVSTGTKVTSSIVSAWPIGTVSYPSAVVQTTRTERLGEVVIERTSRVWLERFPLGWRVTYADPW